MRPALCRLAVASVLVSGVLVLAPAARAQSQTPSAAYYGPYSVYNSNLTALNPAYVQAPTFTTVRIQTTVTVPDRGSVLVGGYSRVSEGRNEFGAPGLGNVPYAGRGFRNVGYGRDATATRVIAGVRIINLYEEEERQTGVRSGR
ncbi:MAG TPA: hypothetical protein VKD72_13970 [Gemmataceae bacterium]|nr:hypothetical protein [Gemmataceae bacterium]